jgi:hypothetical protein
VEREFWDGLDGEEFVYTLCSLQRLINWVSVLGVLSNWRTLGHIFARGSCLNIFLMLSSHITL